MTIKIKRDKHKETTEGYIPFVAALELAYNLREIDSSLQWVDVESRTFSEPEVLLHIAERHPDLSIIIRPENGEGQILRETEHYKAPLALTGVNRWGQTGLDLKDYRIDRWKGRPGPETMFPQSRSLAEIVAKYHADTITDTTPVVEVVALLPTAANGEFKTQFVPHISFGLVGHSHYQISVVAQNALSAYTFLSQGSSRSIKDIDDKQTTYNWMASSFPALPPIEQAMEPSSHGHMILIASPVEAPKPSYPDFGGGFDSLGGGMKGGSEPMSFGGDLSRGASVSSASIGRGSASGKGSLYEGEITASRKGNPIIFHLQFLCVTPTQAAQLDTDGVNGIGSQIGNFERN